MESLSEEIWDVVIAGTSLPQSLLALALSKSGLKILHVDQNHYYGGADAGLSLDEIERWIEDQKGHTPSEVSFVKTNYDSNAIGPSRAYTISLNPQIIYAKSKCLPALVSSQLHKQLEFQAVGQFWILDGNQIIKIPSSREDVFADESLSVRDKRRLMGLLRYVIEEHEEVEHDSNTTLQDKLRTVFKIDHNLWSPVQALTRSTNTLHSTSFAVAIDRLRQHLTSLGYFGPGLAAVLAKYGGNSEIAQVACRAAAVGGAVYLLGHGISEIDSGRDHEPVLNVKLHDGTKVQAKHVVGMPQDLPDAYNISKQSLASRRIVHQTAVLSDPLRPLFTPSTDNGPVPAVAILLVREADDTLPPVYLQIHSEDTGECPAGQSIIYASTLHSDKAGHPNDRLTVAIDNLLASDVLASASVKKLCTFCYSSLGACEEDTPTATTSLGQNERIIKLAPRLHGVALDDGLLDNVRTAWELVLGEQAKDFDFLRFEQDKEIEDDE